MMKAALFMLPQQNTDLHTTLFNTFSQLGIKDFSPSNPDRKRIVFYSNGKFIIARMSAPVDQSQIPLIAESFDAKLGSIITGVVTLNRDRQILIPPYEREAFIAAKGRQPKSSENHKYIRMTDEDLAEYVPGLFEKSGLKLSEFKIGPSPLHTISMVKRGFYYKPVDISFKAEITDIDAFEKAWFEGIGRTKTYGFGMIRAVLV